MNALEQAHLKSLRNQFGLKDSSDQYRNIYGIRYECWTADQSEFEVEKSKARELGLRTRVIQGQLYREVPR